MENVATSEHFLQKDDAKILLSPRDLHFFVPLTIYDTKWCSSLDSGISGLVKHTDMQLSSSSQRICPYLVPVEQIAHSRASQPTTFASVACRLLSRQFLSFVWFGPSRPQFKRFLNKAGIVPINHLMPLDILAVFITPHSLCRWFWCSDCTYV